jgi:serine/threonine protein kinase
LIDDTAVDILSRARVGAVLDDKWHLEHLLGVGGMAAVYSARHRNGARAAIKVLHPHLARHDEVRERFRREGYAANLVEHPGVVKVLDDSIVSTGSEAGTAFIVMELLEGESLQDRIERGPAVDELEFLMIAGSVLDVLQTAHAKGVVHRDLKPENLFLVGQPGQAHTGSGPRVKVLDFGLARLLQGQAITSYGLAVGTPSFMPPEQAAGKLDEIDARADLFALGVSGFRLRTGRRIHEAANAVHLVRKMASLPAPRIRSVAPDVGAPFARVIDRALEFRREDRYESAAAMLVDVRRAIAETEIAPASGSESTGERTSRAIDPEDTTIERANDVALPRPFRGAKWGRSLRVPLEHFFVHGRRRRSILLWALPLLLCALGTGVMMRRRAATPGISRTETASVAVGDAGASAASTSMDARPLAALPPTHPAGSTGRATSEHPTPPSKARPGSRTGPSNGRR